MTTFRKGARVVLTDLRQIQQRLDAVLGAERFDDQFAQERGIRLYDATDRTGRPFKVTIPENDND